MAAPRSSTAAPKLKSSSSTGQSIDDVIGGSLEDSCSNKSAPVTGIKQLLPLPQHPVPASADSELARQVNQEPRRQLYATPQGSITRLASAASKDTDRLLPNRTVTVQISFRCCVAQLWKARTRLCLSLSLSVIIAACFIILAVPVLVTSIVVTTHMPSNNTTLTAYQAQSSEVVFKLATFKGTDYSSFSVTSDIPQGTTTSATVWITHSVEPTSSIYSGSLTLQDKTLQLYALPDSNFEVSFSALSGIGVADENVTVKFTGSKHTDDKSYTIRASTTGQLVNYTASDPGFIQVRVINNGLQGNFSYQFTVKELNSSTLHQSWYRCIMNSTNNVCRHASAEGINCLLVHVTLDNDNRGYPNFDVNLIGREKHVLPLRIALPTTFLVIILCLMVLFVYCVYIVYICIQILKQYQRC